MALGVHTRTTKKNAVVVNAVGDEMDRLFEDRN